MMKNRQKTLPPQELSVFCDQTAMVLKAGIPLYDAMETLCENYRGTAYGERFNRISALLGDNGTLYEAMRAAGVFPEYLLGMIQVGEKAGRLDDVMTSLCSHYSREARMRAAVRSAVAYPTLLVLMMAAVTAVLLTSVIPIFERVYASLGLDMSSASVGAGVALGKTLLIIIGAVVLLVAVVILLLRSGARNGVMGLLAKVVPGVGHVERASFASRFASVMSAMLLSGCDTDEAVEMVSNVTRDSRSHSKVNICLTALKEGKSFPEAVELAGVFDPIYEKMIAVGVRTGSLDTLMGRLASTYDDISYTGIRRIVGAVEPTLVVLLCVAVGGILLSVMLPLLSILAGIS